MGYSYEGYLLFGYKVDKNNDKHEWLSDYPYEDGIETPMMGNMMDDNEHEVFVCPRRFVYRTSWSTCKKIDPNNVATQDEMDKLNDYIKRHDIPVEGMPAWYLCSYYG